MPCLLGCAKSSGELRARPYAREGLRHGTRLARHVARQWHRRARETSEPTRPEWNVEVLDPRRGDRGLVVIARGITDADGETAEQKTRARRSGRTVGMNRRARATHAPEVHEHRDGPECRGGSRREQ